MKDAYRKSSTLKHKETPLEDLTGEAIEGEVTLEEGPKDPVPEEVEEDHPLETPIINFS